MNKSSHKINLYAILEDIQEQLLMELEPDLRHTLKLLSHEARKHTRRLIREFDRVHSSENAENFGLDADELRQMAGKQNFEDAFIAIAKGEIR